MNTLSKVFRTLAVGAVSMTLAACYGTPMIGNIEPAMYGAPPDDGWRNLALKVKTALNEPIGGIQVTFVTYEEEKILMGNTDTSGELIIRYEENTGEYLGLEDVDGPENGGDFESQAVNIPAEAWELEVELTEKTDTPE